MPPNRPGRTSRRIPRHGASAARPEFDVGLRQANRRPPPPASPPCAPWHGQTRAFSPAVRAGLPGWPCSRRSAARSGIAPAVRRGTRNAGRRERVCQRCARGRGPTSRTAGHSAIANWCHWQVWCRRCAAAVVRLIVHLRAPCQPTEPRRPLTQKGGRGDMCRFLFTGCAVAIARSITVLSVYCIADYMRLSVISP